MKTKYTVDLNAKSTQVVGELDTVKISSLLGITFPTSEVLMYPGAIKHIKKRHAKTINEHHQLIPDIISNPDYVGRNPKEPNSIEIYKRVGNILIAIKIDPSGYLYISSMYELDNGQHKIHKRLSSGRIVPF